MSCIACMWFAQKSPDAEHEGIHLGRCRRRAPTLSGFPAVFGTDWCGDHKLDENKV